MLSYVCSYAAKRVLVVNKYHFTSDLHALPLECKSSRRRKTLGLKVSPGRVLVSYPPAIAIEDVVLWVNGKSEWILKHYEPPLASVADSAYSAQDTIFWDGRRERLTVLVECHESLPSNFFQLPLRLQKQLLLALCATLLEVDLSPRIQRWENVLGLHARTIKFRPYKSRWGSCTQHAEVAFNTLLMMAPAWVRDYVVIHELCHIKHLNHSKFFWAEVARACSHQQVKKAKSWLRANGNQLLSIYR